jgi:hypothetical protein
VGAKSERRGWENGMIDPRGAMGGLYIGIQEVASPPHAPSPREVPTLAAGP